MPSALKFLSFEQTYLGLYLSHCCFKSSVLLPPDSAIISNLSEILSITSRACVPIEPVEPNILILRFLVSIL